MSPHPGLSGYPADESGNEGGTAGAPIPSLAWGRVFLLETPAGAGWR